MKKAAPVVVKTSNKELVTPVEIIEPEKPAVNTSELAESLTEKKYTEAKKKKRLNHDKELIFPSQVFHL